MSELRFLRVLLKNIAVANEIALFFKDAVYQICRFIANMVNALLLHCKKLVPNKTDDNCLFQNLNKKVGMCKVVQFL